MTAEELLGMIQDTPKPLVVAIDGRCASGKSTLAQWLKERTGADVLHMDDFFLRKEQRTKERYAKPGGNVDYERFLSQVLYPLVKGQSYTYQPFDCQTMELCEAEIRQPAEITIVEGSYSMRPELFSYYAITVFLTVTPEKQLERIQKRNPEKLHRFVQEWIPYEELYFKTFDLQNRADGVIDTTDLF
ncbi:MAG: deoxynucleoside kinase [Solobacterium sp.]|nr:deoxynucleoside kinase [Solobacterium sp.]